MAPQMPIEPPEALETLEERNDWIARLCCAGDFGLLPAIVVVKERRKLDAFDVRQLLPSALYLLLREWRDLPPLPFFGRISAYLLADQSWIMDQSRKEE